MNTAEKLPVELWLIIFEMVLDPANGPSGWCSHHTFPEIHLRLLSPWKCIPGGLLRQNLRLVCRTFNNVVISSSGSALIESSVSAIPPKTRSVCLSNYADPVICLLRLLAEPAACSRVSTLVMPLQLVYRPGSITDFDLLCDTARFLPNVRRLTLAQHPLMGIKVVKNLWRRVNVAFPLLNCLVLGTGVHWIDEYAVTTFKKLEILDVYSIQRAHGVSFPLLRHAAVHNFGGSELEVFERSRFLESVLTHHIPNLRVGINWTSFKELRVLGIPLKSTPSITSFPPNHPLELLYVYTNPLEGKLEPDFIVQMVKKMVICLPTVTQIHIDIETLQKSRQDSLERHLKASRLKEWGLHVRPLYSPTYQLVVERIPVDSEPESQLEPVTLVGALKRGLGKLTQFGFRRQGS